MRVYLSDFSSSNFSGAYFEQILKEVFEIKGKWLQTDYGRSLFSLRNFSLSFFLHVWLFRISCQTLYMKVVHRFRMIYPTRERQPFFRGHTRRMWWTPHLSGAELGRGWPGPAHLCGCPCLGGDPFRPWESGGSPSSHSWKTTKEVRFYPLNTHSVASLPT